MKFEPNYGVFVCSHVYDHSRPVLVSVRDFDGSWQFICGLEGCVESGEPRLVCCEHLVSHDETINALTCMTPGTYAERQNIGKGWVYSDLDA
ncbi:hypothetical protein [Vibrio cholerae]|uniref:hypothetical protein n=1 Tax=Vibrio cholerae TaxID=666 RepID=UPI001E526894|nr:hypothetical protein [Vibrio cholerae]MCD6678930.1 hypothetical protein [Vibrio cholerae]